MMTKRVPASALAADVMFSYVWEGMSRWFYVTAVDIDEDGDVWAYTLDFPHLFVLSPIQTFEILDPLGVVSDPSASL